MTPLEHLDEAIRSVEIVRGWLEGPPRLRLAETWEHLIEVRKYLWEEGDNYGAVTDPSHVHS